MAILKSISITQEQEDFIKEEKLRLSKFVQGELNDYMRFKEKFKKYMEDNDEKKIE